MFVVFNVGDCYFGVEFAMLVYLLVCFGITLDVYIVIVVFMSCFVYCFG